MLNWQRQSLVVSLSCSLAIAGAQAGVMSAAAQTVAAAPPAAIAQHAPRQRFDAADLDQLVAPIALYPDMLVAEVLAASAHPVEIVEAERWMLQDGAYLHGQALAEAVDQQPWDPSVKALTQFPAVLASMNTNLAWTSALGDAYVTQQPDVLDAVQAMRRRAEAAGNLKSSSEQIVTTTEQTIVIAPAKPQIVYVPQYDPRLVYGAPVAIYPGWTPFPGMYFNEPGILFGAGLGIGLFAGVGWGLHHWGADWHDHRLMHDHATWVAHSREFGFHRGDVPRPAVLRGAEGPHGLHTGAFSGVDHGGVARSYSLYGQSSFHGGFRGGFHGGGFHGGGGHR